MKIVIDLQCCQTAARNRGMGRYSAALTKEIVRIGSQHEFMFLLNYKYLNSSKDIISQIAEISNMGEILYHDYPDVQRNWHEREVREDIASLLRNNRIETVSPDLYHISSLFEGESVFDKAASYTVLPRKPIIRSATLYDFIPYLFSEEYITHWQYANWYKRTLGVAKSLDIGLAISETTKSAALEILKSPHQRLVNILGSVDDRFQILSGERRQKSVVWNRFSLKEGYLLYVGGPDPRKNVNNTLRAFAKINLGIRNKKKLVLVYDVNATEMDILYSEAEALGIRENIILTGFVTDEELVELYNFCDLFIFPSLYEGLGLPVIEAMRCGAPVLVGDNSSQREIVDVADYRFDANSDSDMVSKIESVLSSPDKQSAMRAYSVERAKAFSWEKSARISLEAWEQLYSDRSVSKSSQAIVSTSELFNDKNTRPRIAMFTPLPNAETGIADYSADILPQIYQYADIDVFVEDVASVSFHYRGIEIFHHHMYVLRANEYDVTVFQLGNSPFHHYMLPYIKRFPGVVVIHDAYLGHLSHDPGSPADFVHQVIKDHGGSARSIMHASSDIQTGVKTLIQELTCSSTHIHRSIGVIVHSNFARNILLREARSAISAEIVVIPQYVSPVVQKNTDKVALRSSLGLPTDKTIIGSFGHIAPTKGIAELISSFKASEGCRAGKSILVLVGKLEGTPENPTPFGTEILQAIDGRSDIIITGYVDQPLYEKYVCAIDIGIQLRTITRGETSRAMLTMIVNGIPLIHNKFGSSTELPDDATVGIMSCDPNILIEAIDRLVEQPNLRLEMKYAAQNYTREFLSGRVIADRFVRTVVGMAKRAQSCNRNSLASQIGHVMRNADGEQDFLQEVTLAFINQENTEELPRMLIDVTHIRENDLKTGVQRVVREITHASYITNNKSRLPQTFAFTDDGLVFADDYAQSCGARYTSEHTGIRKGKIKIRPFDRMLLADGSWHLSHRMSKPLQQLNSVGGSAYALVHDILPIQRPDLFPDHVSVSFTKWLSLMAIQCDGLICTSRTAADDLLKSFNDQSLPVKSGLRIGWSYLGSNPLNAPSNNKELASLNPLLVEGSNIYLVVGTIEPRKGHEDIIAAFDKIWASDLNATLVFVGKRGWNIDSLAARMDNHPEAGKRFIELGFVEDALVAQLYRSARAVIIGSIAEGFGLPIFEAAHFGAPLILSDLPVFRELGKDNACYYHRGQSDSLYDVLLKSLADREYLKSSFQISPPKWQEFYSDINKFMDGQNTYFQFE